MADPKVQIIITADGSQAGREVEKAGQSLIAFGGLSVAAGNLLADLGRKAVSAGKDLVRFPLDAAIATGRYAESLEQLQTETGLTADEQQAYEVVLNRVGLGLQDLSGIWRILSTNVLAARDPLSDSAAKFRQLGIVLTGNESPSAVLELVAKHLNELPDGFRKNALATELLGRFGARFLPAFKEGLGGAANEAKRLGTMLSGEALAKASAFDNALDDLSKATEGLTHNIGVLYAPTLTRIVLGLTDSTAKTSRWVQSLNDLDTVLARLASKEGFLLALQVLGGLTGNVAATVVGKIAAPPPPAPDAAKPLPFLGPDRSTLDAAAAAKQEAIGARIVKQTQEQVFWREKGLESQRVLNAMSDDLQKGLDHERDVRNDIFGRQVEAEDSARVLALEFEKTAAGSSIILEKVSALQKLMPELSANEAAELVRHNEAVPDGLIEAANLERAIRAEGLAAEVANTGARLTLQSELYQNEVGYIGAAEFARRAAFAQIQADLDQRLNDETLTLSQITNLELEAEANRRAIVRQYPEFWESQLQAVVNSNSFSLGSIVSTWTGGISTMILKGGDLKGAWESTQQALLQSALNTGVQWLAQAALNISREIGLTALLEATKTSIFTSGAATRVGVTSGEAAATVGIWAGASAAILGWYGTITAGFTAMATTMVAVLTAVGTFVMGVLSAIASALTATVFGIPFAGAILLGVALIAAALAATGNLGFKDGGIGDFGAGAPATLHGREAIIPLDQRGQRFMQGLGFGGGTEQRIVLEVDGEVWAERVLRGMPRAVRMRLGPVF